MSDPSVPPEQIPSQPAPGAVDPAVHPNPGTAPAEAKAGNPVGVAALVIAIVGFIFACIPGALVVGWVLLPIAFILGIVGLVLPHRKRALALSGLIISVVGTVVAVVVFFAVVATSVQDAFGGSESTVAPRPSQSGGSGGEDSTGSDQEVGTRENPAALGSSIVGKEYTIVINSVARGATDQVKAANQFNEDPPAGSSYAVVNATITYNGEGSGQVALVGIDYVTSAGNVVSKTDTLAVPPDPALQLQEIYKGASVTGNVVVTIPDGDDGLLRIRPGMIADDVFVTIS